MMISQTALVCLETSWKRLLGRSVADVTTTEVSGVLALSIECANRAGAARHEPAGRPAIEVPVQDSAPTASAPATDLVADADPGAPLTAPERRARAAALRALAFSRGRRFAAAQAAFVEAARLDPTLDLTRTPAFWKLERAAHEAAIDAYVEAGRERDAAVLRARVRSTFRPKPLRSRQQAAVSP